MKLERIVLGATALTLVMVACGNKQDAGTTAPPLAYTTAVLDLQDASLESVYPASVKGQEDIDIKPRIDGFIDAIYVDEGSIVRKGQSLFKINSPESEQAVLTAKASVNSAQAQVNTAKLNVDRIRPLAEKGIVSRVQLETQENGYQTALAGLSQAKAALTNAQAKLSWTNVTSPVDGVVGNIPLRQGSLVNSSSTLTTVANISNVYAYFSLNEKELMNFLNDVEGKTQAEKIKNMPEVVLTLADGTVYPEKGKIETISGVVSVTTGSANFRASFPNKSGVLKSGISGKVSIPKILKGVIVIPQAATFTIQDKVLVYKVQGDSVVQKTVNVLSTPDGKEYAVTEGLDKGERIVTEGIKTLANGKKITVK